MLEIGQLVLVFQTIRLFQKESFFWVMGSENVRRLRLSQKLQARSAVVSLRSRKPMKEFQAEAI